MVRRLLRHMGCVMEGLTRGGQTVQGAIVFLWDDQRLRRVLAVTPNIALYGYQVSFALPRA